MKLNENDNNKKKGENHVLALGRIQEKEGRKHDPLVGLNVIKHVNCICIYFEPIL